VLGKLAREDEADRGLDLPRRDGRALVILRKLGGLDRNTLENVVDKRVEDRHGLVGDTGVGVDLLEDLVDVGRVGLAPDPTLSLLAVGRLLLGGGLARGLLGGLNGAKRGRLGDAFRDPSPVESNLGRSLRGDFTLCNLFRGHLCGRFVLRR